MAYRYRPKYAELDADNPRAWGQCDRCGFVWPLDKLQWQYAYQGSAMPQNTRFLVCPHHLDPLNPQDTPNILPPDPLPVYNARPGASDPFGETSYLVTEDGDILTTQGGAPFTTVIPAPNEAANTTNLFCEISAPGGDVSTVYLDLFDGNPSSGGRSVLEAITGSSTRTDIASSLTTTAANIALNTAPIVVATASAEQTNISWCGLYSASISGALLMSGPVSVSQTIAEGNPVRFNSLGLEIDLN